MKGKEGKNVKRDARPFVGRAFDLLADVAPAKCSRPVLSTALVEPREGGGAILSGTDLDTFVRIESDAVRVVGTGLVLVDRLKRLLASGDDGIDIAFETAKVEPDAETEPSKVEPDTELPPRPPPLPVAVIRAGGVRVRVPASCPVEDFPPVPAPTAVCRITAPAAAWHRALSRVAPVMSRDETRYNLCGAHIEVDDAGVLRLIGCDAHRMHVARVDAATVNGAWKSAIVPAGAVDILARRLNPKSGAEVTVEIGVTGEGELSAKPATHVVVRANAITYTIRTVDAQYPPWREVVPAKAEAHIVCPTIALHQALQRLVRVSDATRGARGGAVANVDIRRIGASVELVMHVSDDTYEATVDDVRGADSAPECVVLNPFYAIDALDAVDPRREGSVEVTYASAVNPVRFERGGDDGVIAIVMPVRV